MPLSSTMKQLSEATQSRCNYLCNSAIAHIVYGSIVNYHTNFWGFPQIRLTAPNERGSCLHSSHCLRLYCNYCLSWNVAQKRREKIWCHTNNAGWVIRTGALNVLGWLPSHNPYKSLLAAISDHSHSQSNLLKTTKISSLFNSKVRALLFSIGPVGTLTAVYKSSPVL